MLKTQHHPVARLLAKINFPDNPKDDCWEWNGANKQNGYGHFYLDGRGIPAHRAAYFLFNGSIPAGMDVCHACDNRKCINPSHLWLGTRAENLRDAVTKGRMVIPNLRGSSNGNSKLSWDKVRAIRARKSAGESQRELAWHFHVSESLVSQIVKEKIWKELVS